MLIHVVQDAGMEQLDLAARRRPDDLLVTVDDTELPSQGRASGKSPPPNCTSGSSASAESLFAPPRNTEKVGDSEG